MDEDQVNLLAVAKHYTTMTKVGSNGEYRGISPFAVENTPSFFVNAKTRVWKCFSSGAGGRGPLALVQAIDKLPTDEAWAKITSIVG